MTVPRSRWPARPKRNRNSAAFSSGISRRCATRSASRCESSASEVLPPACSTTASQPAMSRPRPTSPRAGRTMTEHHPQIGRRNRRPARSHASAEGSTVAELDSSRSGGFHPQTAPPELSPHGGSNRHPPSPSPHSSPPGGLFIAALLNTSPHLTPPTPLPLTVLSAVEQVAEHLRREFLRGGLSGTMPGVSQGDGRIFGNRGFPSLEGCLRGFHQEIPFKSLMLTQPTRYRVMKV